MSHSNFDLFIDDERDPTGERVWVIARTSSEAIALIEERGMPGYISFDHDLGGDDTSMVFLRWLAEYAMDRGCRFDFEYFVHSQNPIGAANIIGFIESFRRSY
jgi:hypothetical protein